MQRNNNGIALVELLIYLSVVILMSNLLFAYYARTQAMIRACYQQGLRTMRLYAVLDLLKHTLRHAPAHRLHWVVMEPQLLIWQGYDGRHYGFEVRNEKLYKIIGMYDSPAHHWLHAHTIMLLEQKGISFEFQEVTIGTHAMIYAITMIFDLLRLKIILSNGAYTTHA